MSEKLVDVWNLSTTCDNGLTHEHVELLIASNGEVNVIWREGFLLFLDANVGCRLEDLSTQPLENAGQEATGRLTDPLAESSVLDHSVEATNWEDQANFGLLSHGFGLCA